MLPLVDLVPSGYGVVFYDQSGCGRSDRPTNPLLFTIERAVEELEEFRKVSNLGRIHLLGSSYGGLLALTYALKYESHVRSIITTGGLHSVPMARKEIEKMRLKLPRELLETMKYFEEKGDFSNPKYPGSCKCLLQTALL